jgi:hypothetical protein
MRHLHRNADALAQRGMGVDGFADVHGFCADLNGQSNFAQHFQPYLSAVALPQNTRYMNTV